MYEIWLMLNILWETLLNAWPLVLVLLLAIAGALAAALMRQGADWRGAWPPALAAAAVVGALAFLALPALTSSSLGELSYWVDWLALAGIAAGVTMVALALLLPLTVLIKRRTP